jgi:hypothetical protein
MTTDLRQREVELAPSAESGWHRLRLAATGSSVRTAAALWLAAKVAIISLAWVASWIMRPTYRHPLLLANLWQHWDASQFRVIAEYGYFGRFSLPVQDAFFPGYPILLRATHLVIPQWTLAELAIGTIASFFAILGLVRLAEDYQRGSGAWSAVAMLAAPAAVFLAVGYSEAAFLAFALPAWLAARHGRWTKAGLLAGAAGAIRVNGLFLIFGLAIMALLGRTAADRTMSRRLHALGWLSLALLPLASYVLYLRVRTGDWLAWLHAEEHGWQRRFGNPITMYQRTWQIGFDHVAHTPWALIFQLEIVAVTILVVTTLALAWRRHWPEASYCALTGAAMATGHLFVSVPRALLLIFPLWCGLGRLAQRHRWIGGVWVAASVPLMFATTMLYFTGKWAG